MDEYLDNPVYSKDVVEFVTVANQFCNFLEQTGEMGKETFVSTSVKLLPLLYLKATLLPSLQRNFDEQLEHFVTEEDYSTMQAIVGKLLGASNEYLEVFHPDIQFSDTPVRAMISEDLSDIYQDLKDFLLVYEIGATEVMNDGIAELNANFGSFWGQKTVNVLRALHQLQFNSEDLFEEEEGSPDNRRDVNTSFVAQRQKEWQDENDII